MASEQVTRKVKFKIYRYDPASGEKPRYDTFEIETWKGKTVLQGLLEIVEKYDGSLALRYNCRSAVCGSCAMIINNKHRLACQTMIDELKSNTIVVKPLEHYPIIKDLVVDMEKFFEKYNKIIPYMVPKEEPQEDREFLVTPEQANRILSEQDCILCGACSSACPTYATDPHFLGPAALTKLCRFLCDVRDGAMDIRLDIAESEEGVYRCHTAFNCTEACPKGIAPTESIHRLKRKIAQRRIKKIIPF